MNIKENFPKYKSNYLHECEYYENDYALIRNNYTCFNCIHIIELIKRRHAT